MLSPGTQEFDDITQCGTGAYAKVYSAIHCLTGSAVAIKVFDLKKTQDCPNVVDQEISIHRKLDHPFIAQYFGHIREEETVSMIMEYVQGIPLIELVNQSGYIRELEAQKMFCELVSAVYYLHRVKRIVHRDLKLENILLTPQRHVKLIDFGFARENSGVMTTQCASFPYAAPELFNGDGYTEKVDVWALGVILYGMLVGELPFGDGDLRSISENVREKEPNYPDFLSAPVVNLIKLMLNKDQHKRLSIDQVEKHPWLQGTRYAIIMDPEVVLAPNLMVVPQGDELDEKTTATLQKFGVSLAGVNGQYIRDNDDDVTLAYRMMRRANMFQDMQRMFHSVIFPQLSATATSNVANSYLPKLKVGPAGNQPDKKRPGMKFMPLTGKRPTPVSPVAAATEEAGGEQPNIGSSGNATPRSPRVTIDNPNSKRFRPLMKNHMMPLKARRQALPALPAGGDGAPAATRGPVDLLAKTSFNLSVFKQLA